MPGSTMRRRLGAAVGAFCALLLLAAAPEARAAVFDAETFTLGNGLQVAVVENDRAPVVTQLLVYRAGAMDEPRGRSGVAHVLEHMMFKGTEEYGPGEFSAIVSRHGGRDNAFTSQDYTGYYQSVASDRLELVMRLEADRMRNLGLAREPFETERQVVVEERNQRVENEPGALLQEQAGPALYYNHPYAKPIIGWRHELEALELSDLQAYYDRYYRPNNAVLVVVGDVTVDRVRTLAERHYGPIPAAELPPRAELREPPHLAARTVTLRDERVREPTWSRRWIAPSYGTDGPSERVYALQVLMDIVGGGNTSRLYRALVIDQGIAVSAGGWYDETRRGPGAVGVYARPGPETSIDDVAEAAEAVLAEIAREGVSAEEVERAVRRLQDSAATARDSLMGPAQVLARGLTVGLELEDIEQWPARIGKVTVEEVNAAARAVLDQPASVTTRLLPAAESPAGSTDAASDGTQDGEPS